MTEISFDAGAVGDTVAQAKSVLDEALGGDASEVNAADPRVAEALDRLRGNTQEDKDKAEERLDNGAGAARVLEVGDAEGAGAAEAVPVGAGVSTGTGAGAGASRVQPSVQVTPAALAQMNGISPTMSQPMMSQPSMPMSSPMASPMSNLMNAANTLAPLASQAVAPAATAGKIILTPDQQAQLAAAIAEGGGEGETDSISLNAGGGSIGEITKGVLAADLPYAWGGGTLEGPSQGISDGGGAADANGDYNKVGFDCSGLSRYVYYQDTGVEVPRTSQAQYAAGTEVSLAEAKPGDFVFPNSSFGDGGPGHVQVYLGDGKVLEAPQSGDKVKISEMTPSVIKRM